MYDIQIGAYNIGITLVWQQIQIINIEVTVLLIISYLRILFSRQDYYIPTLNFY